jgi:hypothetical protein
MNDGAQNPDNSICVSGLSLRIDMDDLEAAFAEIGIILVSLVGLTLWP